MVATADSAVKRRGLRSSKGLGWEGTACREGLAFREGQGIRVGRVGEDQNASEVIDVGKRRCTTSPWERRSKCKSAALQS